MKHSSGNVVFEWGPDCTVRDFMELSELTDEERCRSARHVFDADGRETATTAPGQLESHSTLSEYSRAGKLTKTTEPDGTWTAYAYDAAGNQVCETRPTEAGGTVSDVSVYDLGGRLVEQIKAAGVEGEEASTTHTYDLLDREISSALGAASRKTYNTRD